MNFSNKFIQSLSNNLENRNCKLKWINSQWHVEFSKGNSVSLTNIIEDVILNESIFNDIIDEYDVNPLVKKLENKYEISDGWDEIK